MTTWDAFFRTHLFRILTPGAVVIDVGGGLRVRQGKGNRFDPKRSYLAPYLDQLEYKILDPVPDYEPDIVGDIHALPLADNSVDAFICIAVLEHVEDPKLALREMHRVLKPGGSVFLYVPFLYYYHAETGYYKDYWRFTEDALLLLGESFATQEHVSVRGALQTWVHLSPLGRIPGLPACAAFFDRLTGKHMSKQVSGYYALFTK